MHLKALSDSHPNISVSKPEALCFRRHHTEGRDTSPFEDSTSPVRCLSTGLLRVRFASSVSLQLISE